MPTRLSLTIALLACLATPVLAQDDAREADAVFNTLDVVIDAPWRVQRQSSGPTEIPVMFFFPETRTDWRRVRVHSISVSDADGAVDRPLYEHHAGSAPVAAPGVRVQDAWGRIAPDLATVAEGAAASPTQIGEVSDENRGFHVMVRIPVTVGPSVRRVALAGKVEIERLDDAGKPTDHKVWPIRRRLEVDVDPEALPMFPGWRTYDTHVHTLAEFDPNTAVKALRKDHGGPMRMILETAKCLGMLEDADDPRGRFITTDHNCYYSDRVFPHFGPTVDGMLGATIAVEHPEWSEDFRGTDGKLVPEGQREFENYQSLLGSTRGEELSLAKQPGAPYGAIGSLSAHMLIHGGRHFCGPFHGGKFLIFKDENPNEIEKVLPEIAASQNFRGAFAYGAHPFTESSMDQRFGTYWTEKQIDYAVHAHVTWQEGGHDQDHVFRGWELWNQRDDRLFDMPMSDRGRMARALEDPRTEKAWNAGNPNWDAVLNFGLMRWHQMICDGFAAASPEQPAVRAVRKLYVAGGSDAHGDFNRFSDCAGRGFSTLPFPLDHLFKGFTIGSNALARVRIAVDAKPADGRSATEQALYAYGHGQGCVTDGPVLDVEVDANGCFDQGRMAWTPRAQFRTTDGAVGGGGRMDGARTALIAAGSAHPVLRFRWRSSPEFGGPLTRIEVYRDEPGKRVKRVNVQRNTGPASVLAPDGQLDPQAPADADGWRQVDVGDVTAPTALSLGGFTARPPTPPYDFRAYTNPVWLLPVAAGLSVDGATRAGHLAPGQLSATFRFPVSMEERPLEVRLIPLDATGATVGEGVLMQPAPEGWTASARADVASSVYRVTNAASAVDLSTTHGGKFCVVLRDPSDTHGNHLNSVAWILEVPGQ